MNQFEDSLLTELRTYVATRAAARPARRRRIARWGLAAIPVGATAAAISLAAILVQSPAAAYAVTKTGNGDVVVTITQLSDAAGLQNALRADGIQAYVSYGPVDSILYQPFPRKGSVSAGPGSGRIGGSVVYSPDPGSSRVPLSGTYVRQDGCSPSITPIEVSLTPAAVTFDIPANDLNTGTPLYITTGGTVGSGLAGLKIEWQC
jgi:hypothetical protein